MLSMCSVETTHSPTKRYDSGAGAMEMPHARYRHGRIIVEIGQYCGIQYQSGEHHGNPN
jgi:hypothetical protein